MSFVLYLVWLFAAPQALATYQHSGPAILPDPTFTPGEVRTVDKNADGICHGTTKDIRKPGIHTVYSLYGVVEKKGICCEIDHLISLELGGANNIKNEWPQPYTPKPGAHEKDQVENWLNKQVCSGKMELQEAQREIATDWYQVYLDMKGKQ